MKNTYFSIVTFVVFMLSSINLFSQPANDNPGGAITIVPSATCTYTTYTNAAATATTCGTITAPGCANYSGGDVWFSVVVPAAGGFNIDAQTGVVTDGGMAVYSGTACGTMNLIACDDDGSANGLMPALNISGQTPGTTLFIRFWEYGNDNNGTFGLCVTNLPPAPANDNCAGAINIASGVACTLTAGTTAGATQSMPGCVGTANDDVWYTFTPSTVGQSITINASASFDPVVQVFSGGCGALTSVGCNDLYTFGGNSTQNFAGLTPGQTYWIRVYDYASTIAATTTFSICAQNYVPPPPNNQDCLGAIPVCQSVYNQTVSYTGTGAIANEINSALGCLASGERNDVWYQFTVQSAGNLCFMINPVSGTDDYDWAVYNLTSNNCSDIFSNGALQVACDYSGQTTYNANAAQHPTWGGPSGNGNTGMVPNPNALDAQVNPCIAVTAGQTFVLNVSNFSSTQSGYTLNFPPPATAGMATIFDNIAPSINSLTATPTCGATSFSFNMSENILCSTVSTGDFTLTGPGGPYTVTGVTGGACAAGAPSENTFTVTVTPAITTAGAYSLCLGTAAGSVTDLCGNVAPAGCFNFNIAGPTLNATPTNPPCPGGTGSILAAGSGGSGSGYTYSIDGGAFGGTTNFTGLAAGTHTVIVRDGGGCQAQATSVITVPAAINATITPTNPGCSGAGSINVTAISGGTAPYDVSFNNGTTYVCNNVTGAAGCNGTGLAAGTYTVVIRDANNCIRTFAVTTLTATGSVSAVFTDPADQCLTGNSFTFNATAGANPVGTTYAWNFGDAGTTAPSTSTSSGAHVYAAAGTYTVTLTVVSGSCNATTTQVITVHPMPVAPTLTSVNPSCGNSNGSISVTAPPAGFTYSLNAVGGPFSSTATWNSLAPGTYTVYVRSNTVPQCPNSATITLTNQAGPTALSLSAVSASCGANNGTVTLSNPVTGGTGPYTFSFNAAAGPFTALTLPNTFTGLAPGTYTVYVRDANNCAYNQTIVVGNNPPPTDFVGTPTNSACSSNTGTITVTAMVPAGAYTYSFNNGVSFGASNTATGLAPGTYTVIIKNAAGCNYSETVVVGTASGPTSINYANNQPTCGASNGQIHATNVGGTAAFTYNVTPGPLSNTTGNFTGLAAGTYNVSITDANGCTFANTTTLTNVGTPTVALTAQSPVLCNGGSTGSATFSASGGTPVYSYAIPTFTTNTTGVFTGMAAGTYTVTVTDATPCTATQTVTITQPTVLASSITVQAPVSCFGGNNGSVTVAGSGGTSPYTFSLDGGAFGPSGTFTGLTAGAHTVTVRDANNCTVVQNVTITQPTAITNTNSSVNANCGTATGTATVNPSGGTPTYTFSWTGGGGTAATTIGLVAGTYTVTITDANSCTATQAVTIANNAGPTDFVGTPTNTACTSNTGTITVTAEVPAAAYTYSFNNGATFQASNIGTNLGAGTYTVVIKNGFGCIYSETVTVGTASGPTNITYANNQPTCGASNGQIHATTVGGTATYTYLVNPGALTNTNGNFTALAAGTYTVQVTDNNGCVFSNTTTLTNAGSPTVVVTSQSPTSCFGGADGTVVFTASGGSPGYTYSIPVLGSNATGVYSGLSAATYTVTVTDALSCTSTTTVTITQPTVVTSAIVTQTPVLCFGGSTGSVTVSGSGGSGAYTFALDGSPVFQASGLFTGLSAGPHTVTVKDGSGCTVVQNVTITQPTALTLTSSSVNANCGQADGTATVVASGGTSGYTYAWALSGGTAATTTPLVPGTYTATVTDANSCVATLAVTIGNNAPPTDFVGTPTNSSCVPNNGTITVTAMVPAGVYTYSFDNGVSYQASNVANGLAPGTYTVFIKNAAGCTYSETVTVGVTLSPTSITYANVQSTCGASNGQVVATAVGGTGPYTFTLTPPGTSNVTGTFASLLAGTYTVALVDANGCTFSNSTTVNNSGSPTTVVGSQTAVSCNGGANGSVTFSTTGGAPGYTYNIPTLGTNVTGVFTGLSAQTYTVTVTDLNSCTTTQTVTITQPTALTSSISAQTAVLCNGGATGSVTVVGSGGTPAYTFSLDGGAFGASGSFTGLTAGPHTVTVRDANNCTVIQNVTITQPTALTLVMSSVNANCTAANGTATVVASGGTSGYTYSWTGGGGTAATTVGVVSGNYTVTVTDANLCVATANTTVGTTPGGSLTLSVINHVSCNGGADGSLSSSVTATSATSYNYTLMPGSVTNTTGVFTNLAPNNYTVTVVDNFGCTATTNTIITEPIVLSLNLTFTNVSCNGASNGTINANAAGGTTPYSYSWSNGAGNVSTISGLPVGTYSCTVTDNKSCTATANVTVVQPPVLAITPVVTNSNCGQSDGAIAVTGSGGSGGYTYSLNSPSGPYGAGNFTGLAAGPYTITIHDASNCTKDFIVNVIDQAGITASITSSVNVTCNGLNNGTATAAGAGGSGNYSFLWSNTQLTQTSTNLSPGLHSVTITDNITGCSASAGVTITQPTPLVVNTSFVNPKCNGSNDGTATALANGGTGAYNYTWTTIPAQNTPTATGLIAGTYNVIVTDANSCTVNGSVVLNDPAAVIVTISKTDVLCNSACDGTATALVSNATGSIAYSWNDPANQSSSSASGLCAGVFTCNVVDFNGCTASANVTINQPTPLTAVISSQTNILCSGTCVGSGTVTAGGGTPGYTYSWTSGGTSSVENNLCVGPQTVTVTDAHGCVKTTTVTITEPNPVTVTVTGTNLLCFNDNSGTATGNYAGGVGPYTFLWQPSLLPGFAATGLPAGTHTLIVTDANGCFASDSVTLTQPTQLTAVASATNSNCGQSNGTALVSAGGGAGLYTFSWLPVVNAASTSALYTNIPANVYNITVTDANGCTAVDVANVNDIAAPTISNLVHTDITCFGANDGTAGATVAGGISPYLSTTWLPGPGTGNTATGLSPGIHTIKVVDAAGCISSANVTILEPTQLVTAITSVTHVSCFGLSDGAATISAVGGTQIAGSYNFLWAPAGQTTATVSNFAAGTYTCTVTDGNGCTSSKSVTINQPTPLIVSGSPGGENVICNGNNDGKITISVAGGTSAYAYGWAPATNSLGMNLNGPVATNLAPGSYTVTVTDAHGCVDFASYNITEPTPVTATVNVVPSTCGLSNGQASVTASGGTPNAIAPFYFYSWNSNPTSSTASINNVPQNVYTCIVTDSHGCTFNASASVTDLPGPQLVSIASTPVTCNGFSDGTVSVTDTSGTGPLTATWTNSLGSNVATHGGLAVNNTDLVAGLPAGLYNVNVTDANGCFFNSTVSIVQPTPLLVPISAPVTICSGGLPTQQTTVNASANGGSPAYTYSWTLDGNPIANGPNPAAQTTSLTNNSNTAVVHTYGVSVVDNNGCPAVTNSTTVTVNPMLSATTTPVSGCSGATVTLASSASGGNGGPYTYSWNNTVATANQNVTIGGSQPTVYTVTVSDGCSAPATASVAITVNPNPVGTFVGNNLQGCAPLDVTFNGSSSITNSTFDWNFGDGNLGTGASPLNQYDSSGQFSVTMMVTSPLGCRDTIVKTNYITIFPNPVADFTTNLTTTSILDPQINFTNQSTGAIAYSWNFGDTFSTDNTSTVVNPDHEYLNAGTYQVLLVAYSDKGCIDTQTVVITVEPDFAIYVPNAFSPNEDGKNENFFPKGVGVDETRYKMAIFDRWGELIFETNNFQQGWDGTANGGSEKVQEDVYVWKIQVFDLKNNKHNLVGHVTVVK